MIEMIQELKTTFNGYDEDSSCISTVTVDHVDDYEAYALEVYVDGEWRTRCFNEEEFEVLKKIIDKAIKKRKKGVL